jgi:hypothetical protein
MQNRIAVIVEWDNARLSEVDRAREMLRRLQAQAVSVARTSNARFDLILVVDPDAIAREVPETVLAECISADIWPGGISLIEAPGNNYYDQKNIGVQHTDADIVVLIDSDVVPDEGWLGQLLDALGSPGVDVVSGETYLATDTYYDRLLASFWLFDVKRPPRPVYEVTNFYANNVAFRGDIIRRFPFPTADTYRGQCTTLAKTLRAAGIKLYRAGGAMVSHPPPSGLSHFVTRAICHGHDITMSNKRKSIGWLKASPLGAALRYIRDVAATPGRIVQRRHVIRSVTAGILAFGLAVVYATIKFFGEILTFISPRFVRSRFSI